MCKNTFNHIPLGYVTKKSGKNTRKYGLYICKDCEKEFERQLYEAKLKDCFCSKCAMFHKKTRKDKNTGVSHTRLYKIYQKMKNRCNNENNDKYSYYGGRGISIADEWKDFKEFKNWSLNNGYKDDLTIDRIDVNGNYEPSNCRWVNRKIQQRNQRKLRSNNTTGYRGVSKHQKGFIVQITVDNKSKYLGVTKTSKEGAILYDAYVLSNGLEHTTNFDYTVGFVQEVQKCNFIDAVNYVSKFV